MAGLETAESTVKGLRQAIQDLVVPEFRALQAELKTEMRAINERLDRMDARFDRMDDRMDRLEQSMTAGFEHMRHQLDTYADVQGLKERMARMEGERSTKPTA